MAQFDVYVNPNPATREAIPYVLDVQHQMLAGLATRVVVPLADSAAMRGEAGAIVNSVFEIDGRKLVMLAPQLAAIPSRPLDRPVVDLSSSRQAIIAALDFVFTGV